MNSIYKDKISKEDFKRALGSCFKESWIMHSQSNFEFALQLKRKSLMQFNVSAEIENESDFESSSAANDVMEYYFNNFKSQNPASDELEVQRKWKKAWMDLDDLSAQNVDGFDILKFEEESIIDGNLVGAAAQNYFAAETILKNENRSKQLKTFDLSGLPFNVAVEKTQELIKTNDYEYLFEAAFGYDNFNLKTRCDVLKLNQNDSSVEIIEIKATSKVKKEHFFDLMYQYFVLTQNNLVVSDVKIGHIRSNYIRGQKFDLFSSDLKDQSSEMWENTPKITFEECLLEIESEIEPENYGDSDDLDFEGFFEIDSLSWGTSAKRLSLMNLIQIFEKNFSIHEILKEITNLYSLSEDKIVSYLLKPHCITTINKNAKNIFLKVDHNEDLTCYHALPYYDKTKENIFNFTGLKKKNKALIFHTTGKVYLSDFSSLDSPEIPKNPKNESLFSEANHRHFEVYKKFLESGSNFDESQIIYKEFSSTLEIMLKKYLDYPIYMYDFETVKWAIPKFNQSKSYQQIPFQYSIDIIKNQNYDYKNPNTMDHYDFLASDTSDPRPAFIKNFLKDIFKSGPGVYVAYNDAFEKMVLKHLALLFPKYRKSLLYVAQNTIDLMDFFKGSKSKGIPWFLIYHPLFHGSYSIKKTQPALEGDFSYQDLIINKGDKASQIFRQFSDGAIKQKIWEENVREDMIKYCNRDTLAMVVVLQRITEIFKKYKGEQ
ncbi:hypothetical protein SSABA_v1c02950 [Spiroplasma sabaudiense Ar-1343]|uniref:DUF2779 domain-containing protein n=1 Tax=Spiroplasma sabaudiense Ar-1343 TaxID=1276257 RepID=W6A9M9_9MOLU|nr:DUF2779 domain-containing protein [Spiroplasma sabaudiense]AHI53707.1 hypothetical protein SSABA_v1c02950 [Spiroplasma sabaudiense Ar-1343]